MDLKSQLARMREDWIEEECHRVEAQLALKEARKEIDQLKQVIETMRSSLADKDKGIQKYFMDINIQNRKLESLLQSMEMAHSGSLRDELCLDFPCDSPDRSFTGNVPFGTMGDGLSPEEQGTEEAADSELLVGESMADGTDLFDEVVTAATTEAGDLELLPSSPGAEVPEALPVAVGQEEGRVLVDCAVQTDLVPYGPAVSEFIQFVLQFQDACPSGSASPDESAADWTENFPESTSACAADFTAGHPNSAIVLSPVETTPRPTGEMTEAPENRLMRELDFAGSAEGRLDGVLPRAPGKQYWSSSFLVDLLAVAAPMVPTLLWAFTTQRGRTDPVYNIGALLRGCCLVALHSLRRTAFPIKT